MLERRLVVPLFLLSLSACADSTLVSPAGDRSDPRPELGTANGPANPGNSFVFRSNDGIFLTTVDETQDLVIRHYDAGNIDFCGGTAVFPTAEAQLVLTPGGAIYVWRTGVLPVYVYRLSEVPPQEESPQFCSDLKTKWIYRGTHHLTNHDNNLFFEPGRTNSFGFNGEGKLSDRTGKRFSYRESLLVVVAPEPFRVFNERYTLVIK